MSVTSDCSEKENSHERNRDPNVLIDVVKLPSSFYVSVVDGHYVQCASNDPKVSSVPAIAVTKSILGKAEHQQRLAVAVTLYSLNYAFDTPFLV